MIQWSPPVLCEHEHSPTHNNHSNNPSAAHLCSVPEPPQIIRHLEPKVVSAGRAVRFSVQVSGLPKPQVCWYRDSQALIAGDTCKFFHDDEEHTLMLLNVLAEDAGTYSCEAKNEYGEATSSAPLTVEGTSAGAAARRGHESGVGAVGLCSAWPWSQTQSCITTIMFHLFFLFCCLGNCLPVPKMAESMARVSAPVLVAPMEDVLVFEKHRAQFQCRISGEGSAERPAPLGSSFSQTFSSERHVSFLQSGPCYRLCLTNSLCPDLLISWFCGGRELVQSEILRMSHDGDRYQLEITTVLPSHEGEYSCVAANSAGMVTCSASLNLDGE